MQLQQLSKKRLQQKIKEIKMTRSKARMRLQSPVCKHFVNPVTSFLFPRQSYNKFIKERRRVMKDIKHIDF